MPNNARRGREPLRAADILGMTMIAALILAAILVAVIRG